MHDSRFLSAVWEGIGECLRGAGCDIEDSRVIRDVHWPNLRRATLKKRELVRRQPQAAAVAHLFTQLDETVMSVVGGGGDCPSNAQETSRYFGLGSHY